MAAAKVDVVRAQFKFMSLTTDQVRYAGCPLHTLAQR